MTYTIGSLCAGVGGLDLAVEDVFDAAPAWFSQYEPPDKDGRPDKHQWAAQVLEQHWPGVPNLGDLTAIDWENTPPVDILTAGFPCQNLSLAGRREGLRRGNRSGVWFHIATAIQTLRPSLVVIENVPGILTAEADGDVEPCPWCLGDASGEPPLRALGAVLADLARIGFDAQWTSVNASDVGASHRRRRVFLIAWPADAQGPRLEVRREGRPGGAVQDPDGAAGGERRVATPGQAAGGRPRADARGRGRAPAPDTEGLGRGEGRPESARQRRGPDVAERGGPAAADPNGAGALAERDRAPHRPETVDEHEVQDAARCVLDWGPYGPAIARWEHVMGRPAPYPTEPGKNGPRLSPRFVEWMQGLDDGWVTDTGIPRNAQLKCLGNLAMPQQGAYALRLLLADAQGGGR
jgi:DNA (cytosine-5)-methyltransferase 1